MEHFDASKMLAFDLETTSVDTHTARIVTSALVTIEGSHVDTTVMLADPGVEIPEEAVRVHGITTEKARAEGRPHEEVLRETVRRIQQGWETGHVLIVYNAPYDLSVLRALTGDFDVTGPVFDPFAVDNIMDKYRKGHRTLTDVCKHYDVRLDNAHEASADAIAAARIAWRMLQTYPQLKEQSLDELMEMQAVGFYDMMESRRAYFASKGRDTSTICSSWPMKG